MINTGFLVTVTSEEAGGRGWEWNTVVASVISVMFYSFTQGLMQTWHDGIKLNGG